jgi:hypothetical protein
VFLLVVGHFDGERVAVSFLADSRVGSVSPFVAAFQGFVDGSVTVGPHRFGGKRHRVGDLAADDVKGSGERYPIGIEVDGVGRFMNKRAYRVVVD